MINTSSSVRIVGISGSLRSNSYNTALLHAAGKAIPDTQFSIADISGIPFFNEDNEKPHPKSVMDLKDLIVDADAVVISTPEYNGMISGVLKNTLEWLSRPQLGQPCSGKPLGIMGASTTAFGTSSAQTQLRQLAFALNMHVLNRPLVRIGTAAQKFDSDGTLTDDQTKESLKQFMESLIKWTHRLTVKNV